MSKELPEDDPVLGASDLASAIEGCDRSFFFGITCGLSAPYVGGQIEKAMSIPSCTAVLVGGCWVLGARWWVLVGGCWVLGAGCWVLGAGGTPSVGLALIATTCRSGSWYHCSQHHCSAAM